MSGTFHGESPSYIYTKETFRQFEYVEPIVFSDHLYSSGLPKNEDLRCFRLKLYRYFNLSLADALEQSNDADHVDVNKTIRRLRWCASTVLIEETPKGVELKQVGEKCRSKFCFICNRIKSAKIGNRFIKLVNKLDVDDYRFYFLTLTLRNSDTIRNYNYLSELKNCHFKLFRSKIFKEIFGKENGIIQAYENSIVRGNHIHSHNLIYSPRIKMAVNKAQSSLIEKWKKITKDSHNLKLDLVAKGRNYKDAKEYTLKDLAKEVREIFKYSTKLSFKEMNQAQKNRLARWVIDSKHQNFTNTKGLFRGHQLTSLKSESLDDPLPQKEDFKLKGSLRYGLTKNMKFNFSPIQAYTKKGRSEIFDKVKMISFDSYDVSHLANQHFEHFKYNQPEKDEVFISSENVVIDKFNQFHRNHILYEKTMASRKYNNSIQKVYAQIEKEKERERMISQMLFRSGIDDVLDSELEYL